MDTPDSNLANDNCGWASRFPVFQAATLDEIVNSLTAFVRDSTPEQIRAWKASIPPLQVDCNRVLTHQTKAPRYGAVLEYRMPESLKRVDAVLLVSGAVLVVELKGDGNHRPDYLEQVADYARNLYWHHALCGEDRVRVHALVVSYGSTAAEEHREWITLTNIDKLHEEVSRFDRPSEAEPIPVERFIAQNACQPAPSLVQAARIFFEKHSLPRIKRIDDVTGAALKQVLSEIGDAHSRKCRKLVLLSGVPGAGKTYVGLKIAHDPILDDLSEELPAGGKPTAPAIFLSGNKPLVEVLQYEMRRAGGDGKVFVRGVKEFIVKFSKQRLGAPPHHVLIFDEAQRAWDAEKVRASHKDPNAVSEPESFISFAERIPGWSVVMGLVGEGQQIYTGEEGGIELWADAVTKGGTNWEVAGPEHFRAAFESKGVRYQAFDALHLSQSVRFHFAQSLSDWASGLVEGTQTLGQLAKLAHALSTQGYQIRITRNLSQAQQFLWDKYRNKPEARFGLMTSGRDKGLKEFGVNRVDTRTFRAGPWYADPESSPSSCRRLSDAITEFSAQGLELDHALLAWGTDFLYTGGKWDDSLAMRYQKRGSVKNPLQLRKNAYRVLLTRGREGIVICLPQQLRDLDETFEILRAAGCVDLSYEIPARDVSTIPTAEEPL